MRNPLQPNKFNQVEAGFTLVELSVVLLLIALIALLVFPAIPRFTVEGLKQEAREIASFFRGIVADSFLKSELQKIAVDFEKRRIWLIRCVPVDRGVCEWKDTDKEVKIMSGVDIEYVRAGMEEYSSGEIEIPLFPGGRSLPILVKLRKGDSTISVFYNSFSGDVEIFEGDQEVFLYEKE